MALPFQNVTIPFVNGLDTKTDEKLVIPPKLTDLQNGIFTEAGEINKRNGYTELAVDTLTGGTLSEGQALAVFEDELLQFSGGRLYSWSPGVSKWVDKCPVSPLVVKNQQVARNNATQTNPDTASTGGVTAYAWNDSRGGIRATVVDAVSGVPFLSDVEVNSGSVTNVRVAAFGGALFIYYADTTNVRFRRIDPAAPGTLETEATAVSDMTAGFPNFDIFESGPFGVLAYNKTTTIRMAYLLSDGTTGDISDGVADPISVTGDADGGIAVIVEPTTRDIVVAHIDGAADVITFGRAVDFTSLFAPTTPIATTAVRVTGIFESTTSIEIYYEESSTDSFDHLVHTVDVTTAGALGSPAVFKRSVGLAHRPFKQGDTHWVGLAFEDGVGAEVPLQAAYFLVSATGFIGGKVLPTLGAGLRTDSTVGGVVADASGAYSWAAGRKTKIISQDSTFLAFTGVTRSTYDFTSDNVYSSGQIGGNLLISGGVVGAYDGHSVVEENFHIYPHDVTLAAIGAGSITGSVQVSVVAEWVDARGQIHRSFPSLAETIALTAEDFTVEVPTLRVTEKDGTKRADIDLVVYATEPNLPIFYKVATLTNDVTADSVTSATLVLADIDTSAEVLYTTGGIVGNEAPPAAEILHIGKNRVYLGGLEEENQLYFSKEHIPGEGLGFSGLFSKQVDPNGGPITAVGTLDDKIIIFKQHRIFAFAGEGPLETGLQDTFGKPELITTDVGCEVQKSVEELDLGLVFKSAKGIYLLSPQLQPGYIGAEVERFNDETVTSATLLTGTNQVRFTTRAGRCLVFDYFFRQWSTFTNHEAEDAVVWAGVYQFLKSDGAVRSEDSTSNVDVTNRIPLVLSTAWVKAADQNGYMSVRRAAFLGDFKSKHKLQVQIAYDHQPVFTSIHQWEPDTVLDAGEVFGDDDLFGDDDVFGGVEDNQNDFEILPNRHKCTSIRFKFTDITGVGPSYSISGLTLELAIKQGLNKFRPAKKVGG